ncbi:MAG: sigma 54-interacting transcriptional regulator [Pseudomonadota bacterium]
MVDDDVQLLKLLHIRLQSEGYQVTSAHSCEAAIRLLSDQLFSLVLTDLRMPEKDGLDLLDYINSEHQSLPVILMSAHGSIDEAVQATEKGALGFLTKPINHQQLRTTLNNALSQVSSLQVSHGQSDIIYTSEAMHCLMTQVGQIATREVSLLITGASGTGKELLAKTAHKASQRADKPFIAINCGALPENLLESELFGHKKGAFTGAISDHKGLFQAADGGTLFLDEIGDMPMALQVKLLRVLQEKTIRQVGSTTDIPVDVRVFSATHKDLQTAMDAGQFREDLYYRLCVVNLHLPSLAERPEDVPVLARHWLHQCSEKHGVRISRFADDAMLKLCQYRWPGNIRQLINVVEQCVALSKSPIINLTLVNRALLDSHDCLPKLSEAKEAFERQYIRRVLKVTDGIVSKAAEISGRNRTDFYKLIKKHQLNIEDFKGRHLPNKESDKS